MNELENMLAPPPPPPEAEPQVEVVHVEEKDPVKLDWPKIRRWWRNCSTLTDNASSRYGERNGRRRSPLAHLAPFNVSAAHFPLKKALAN
jgi:hypothetical protein